MFLRQLKCKRLKANVKLASCLYVTSHRFCSSCNLMPSFTAALFLPDEAPSPCWFFSSFLRWFLFRRCLCQAFSSLFSKRPSVLVLCWYALSCSAVYSNIRCCVENRLRAKIKDWSRCAHAYYHARGGLRVVSEIVAEGRKNDEVRVRVVTLGFFFF